MSARDFKAKSVIRAKKSLTVRAETIGPAKDELSLRPGGICQHCGCHNPAHPICGVCGLFESDPAEALLLARYLHFEGGPFCAFCESTELVRVCDWPSMKQTPKRIELAEVGDVWITQQAHKRGRIVEIENQMRDGKPAAGEFYHRRIWIRIPGHSKPYPYERTNGEEFTTEAAAPCDISACWRHLRYVGNRVHYCMDHWKAWEAVA